MKVVSENKKTPWIPLIAIAAVTAGIFFGVKHLYQGDFLWVTQLVPLIIACAAIQRVFRRYLTVYEYALEDDELTVSKGAGRSIHVLILRLRYADIRSVETREGGWAEHRRAARNGGKRIKIQNLCADINVKSPVVVETEEDGGSFFYFIDAGEEFKQELIKRCDRDAAIHMEESQP